LLSVDQQREQEPLTSVDSHQVYVSSRAHVEGRNLRLPTPTILAALDTESPETI
jgi:hypothetical protein